MKKFLLGVTFLFLVVGYAQSESRGVGGEGDIALINKWHQSKAVAQKNAVAITTKLADVKHLMRECEYNLWEKIDSKFSIGYGFVKTKCYQANKKEIQRYAFNVYDYAYSQRQLRQRLYITCFSDSCLAVFCDALLAERQLKHRKFAYKVTEYISLEVTSGLVPTWDVQGSIVAYKTISTTVVCNPSGARFYGAKLVIENDKKDVDFSAIGYIYFDGMRYDVNINNDNALRDDSKVFY